MAVAKPAQFRRVDDLRDCVARDSEHFPEAGMHQKRLFVFDEKLIEFNVKVGNESRDTINVWSDFGDVCDHGESFCSSSESLRVGLEMIHETTRNNTNRDF